MDPDIEAPAPHQGVDEITKNLEHFITHVRRCDTALRKLTEVAQAIDAAFRELHDAAEDDWEGNGELPYWDYHDAKHAVEEIERHVRGLRRIIREFRQAADEQRAYRQKQLDAQTSG